MTEINIAIKDLEIASCWDAVSILRPMLKKENFIQQIKTQQGEGYTLLYISENGHTVSIAGYRIMTMLHSGRMLYIDDLSTLEICRGKGYASLLLNYMYKIALSQNCKSIQLDSGHARTDAHKLYFKEKFAISAYHFNKIISS